LHYIAGNKLIKFSKVSMMCKRIKFSGYFRLPLILCVILQLAACTNVSHTPAPEYLFGQTEVSGFPGVRSWADVLSDHFTKDILERRQHIKSAGLQHTTLNILALSGGGKWGLWSRNTEWLVGEWNAAGI
jgi:hypothetical protein